jgi:hypothetical protein
MTRTRVAPFWACVIKYASEHGITTVQAQPYVEDFWPGLSEKDREPYKELAREMTISRRTATPPLNRREGACRPLCIINSVDRWESIKVKDWLHAIIPNPPEAYHAEMEHDGAQAGPSGWTRPELLPEAPPLRRCRSPRPEESEEVLERRNRMMEQLAACRRQRPYTEAEQAIRDLDDEFTLIIPKREEEDDKM